LLATSRAAVFQWVGVIGSSTQITPAMAAASAARCMRVAWAYHWPTSVAKAVTTVRGTSRSMVSAIV
jgi:hypothetical protein